MIGWTSDDIRRGLRRDEECQARYARVVATLESGLAVESWTLNGARRALGGVTACIANKRAELARRGLEVAS